MISSGCSAEYAGLLDGPWSSVVDALNNLVTTHLLSDSGIINVIKRLQTYFSEAIMAAMNNGPDLEQKVSETIPQQIYNLTKNKINSFQTQEMTYIQLIK